MHLRGILTTKASKQQCAPRNKAFIEYLPVIDIFSNIDHVKMLGLRSIRKNKCNEYILCDLVPCRENFVSPNLRSRTRRCVAFADAPTQLIDHVIPRSYLYDGSDITIVVFPILLFSWGHNNDAVISGSYFCDGGRLINLGNVENQARVGFGVAQILIIC